MFDVSKNEVEIAGRTLTLESGKIARQADGAVVLKYGDSSILATAVAQKKPSDMPFFPLTVHYIEKFYTTGKIPGGFFKREGKPTEKETLTSRLIDRPLRPSFVEGFQNDTQIICQVLSYDLENDPDVLAINAASAALTISGIPFMGPVGAARVGRVDGELILFPTDEQLKESDLNLVVAGTKQGVLMVESEASELTEEQMLDAVMFGWEGFQPIIDAIIGLAEQCAKEPWDLIEPAFDKKKLQKDVAKLVGKDIEKAYGIKSKQDRSTAIDEARNKAIETLVDEEKSIDENAVKDAFKKVEADHVRSSILKDGERIDGRGKADVRQIVAETEIVPRVHGSALFTRGETQALVIATLGTGQDEQIVDVPAGEYRESFMLHYNFPPYSVGETGRMGAPGRREIGHGKLAYRALSAMIPSADDFPYTIRAVSEVTESNGSSSMATVCGTSMALMDAGVPVKKAVSGIAMGLIKEGKDYAVLSDIMGDEDHLGDMDFKVAGTQDGITALQMDIKITSVTKEIMKVALEQAKDGRLHILKEMSKGISASREDVSDNAPRMETFSINPDKIREVIGSGGKTIREIVETTGAKVDIDDDGIVKVSSVIKENVDAAMKWIQDIVAEPELNETYKGTIVNIVDFGAFVNFLGKRDGLLHISQIAEEHVNKVTDFLQEGETVNVKVIGIDDRGKVKLTMKDVDQAGTDQENKEQKKKAS